MRVPKNELASAAAEARRWSPAVALWLLAFGLHTFDWGYGVVRALLLLAVAAIAFTGLWWSRREEARPPNRPPRPGLVVIVVLLTLSHPALMAARHVSGHPGGLSDLGTTTLAAAHSLERGENPYAAPIDSVAAAALGPAYSGYKYLPVTPLLYAPLGLPLGEVGILLTNLALDAVVVVLVFLAARRLGGGEAGLVAAAIYLSLPEIAPLLAGGVTELAAVTPLLASLLLVDRRPGISGLLVGLSLSCKPLPALAALPACLPQRGRVAFGLGVAIGLTPTVLAFVAGPRAFFDNIVAFNFVRPTDSTSWMAGLPPTAHVIAQLAFGAVWLALAAVALRSTNAPGMRFPLVVLLVTAVLLAGPAIHQNYDLWWAPFIAVATALGVAREDRRAASPSSILSSVAPPH